MKKHRLTDELIAQIAEKVKDSGTPLGAAVIAGIPSETFKQWLETAQHSQSGPELELVKAIQEAEKELLKMLFDCLSKVKKRKAQRSAKNAQDRIEKLNAETVQQAAARLLDEVEDDP